MKIKLLLSAIGLTCFFTQVSVAQTALKTSCLSDKLNQQLEAENPQLKANRAVLEAQIQQYISQHQNLRQASGIVLKIPVVIHVVTATGCNGISKAQVLNGLEVVNKDFRRQNADTVNTRAIFKPVAGDTEIEFVLARKTPNGQPTDGINRITSSTALGTPNWDDVKIAAPAWPTDKYFNIWLVEDIYDAQLGGNVLGFTYFPNVLPSIPNKFGAVLVHTVWGKQGTVSGSTANSSGHYATHEIAHCLNLLHIETMTCTDDDGVSDTPPSIFTGPISGTCDFNQNTCHNDVSLGFPMDMPDQIENYMCYSDLSCVNMFTNGQRNRMKAAINVFPQLQNLVSPMNAIVTGIDPSTPVGTLLATPYFCVNNQRVCAGSTVTFSDKSYGPAATSWSWSFPGGTPATSNLQNPVVTYNTPGNYDVSLSVGSSAGIANNTWTNHIKVVPATNPINVSPPNFYEESFEEASFPVSATQNRSWEKATSSLAASPENWTRVSSAFSPSGFVVAGANSLRLQNANLPAGTVSTLITPNFFAPTGIPSHVSIDLAYAKNTAQPTEVLKMYYSHDCGITWNGPIKTLTGNQLVTNGGAQVSNFVPTALEWRWEELISPNQQSPIGTIFGNAPHVMFKLEVTSNGGGNMYIDNFRIGMILGTKESLAAQNIQLFPNPLTAETGIHFELKTPQSGQVKIFDVLGNEVYKGRETTFSAGKHTVSLAEQKLSAGIFMVQLNLGGKLYNTKLLVQ